MKLGCGRFEEDRLRCHRVELPFPELPLIFRPEPLYAWNASSFTSLHFSRLYPSLLSRLLIMSDYEEEMDVDAPSKVQFTSENASGKKRTAADLPVEAQDNLPW